MIQLGVPEHQFGRVRHVEEKSGRQTRSQRFGANAMREVRTARCSANGDSRQLLQSERARVEVLCNRLEFARNIHCAVRNVLLYCIACGVEILAEQMQFGNVDFAVALSERKKLRRNRAYNRPQICIG